MLSDSVTSIGDYAFSDCSSLKNVFFDGTIAEWKSISSDAGESSDTGNVTVKCSDGELRFSLSDV